MNRIILYCIVLVFFGFRNFTYGEESHLGAEWKFIDSDHPRCVETNFDTSAWRSGSLPVKHVAAGYFGGNYRGDEANLYTGWLRKEFPVSITPAGKALFLKIKAVGGVTSDRLEIAVYLNAAYLGSLSIIPDIGDGNIFTYKTTHAEGEFEITDLIFNQASNVLSIKVNNSAGMLSGQREISITDVVIMSKEGISVKKADPLIVPPAPVAAKDPSLNVQANMPRPDILNPATAALAALKNAGVTESSSELESKLAGTEYSARDIELYWLISLQYSLINIKNESLDAPLDPTLKNVTKRINNYQRQASAGGAAPAIMVSLNKIQESLGRLDAATQKRQELIDGKSFALAKFDDLEKRADSEAQLNGLVNLVRVAEAAINSETRRQIDGRTIEVTRDLDAERRGMDASMDLIFTGLNAYEKKLKIRQLREKIEADFMVNLSNVLEARKTEVKNLISYSENLIQEKCMLATSQPFPKDIGLSSVSNEISAREGVLRSRHYYFKSISSALSTQALGSIIETGAGAQADGSSLLREMIDSIQNIPKGRLYDDDRAQFIIAIADLVAQQGEKAINPYDWKNARSPDAALAALYYTRALQLSALLDTDSNRAEVAWLLFKSGLPFEAHRFVVSITDARVINTIKFGMNNARLLCSLGKTGEGIDELKRTMGLGEDTDYAFIKKCTDFPQNDAAMIDLLKIDFDLVSTKFGEKNGFNLISKAHGNLKNISIDLAYPLANPFGAFNIQTVKVDALMPNQTVGIITDPRRGRARVWGAATMMRASSDQGDYSGNWPPGWLLASDGSMPNGKNADYFQDKLGGIISQFNSLIGNDAVFLSRLKALSFKYKSNREKMKIADQFWGIIDNCRVSENKEIQQLGFEFAKLRMEFIGFSLPLGIDNTERLAKTASGKNPDSAAIKLGVTAKSSKYFRENIDQLRKKYSGLLDANDRLRSDMDGLSWQSFRYKSAREKSRIEEKIKYISDNCLQSRNRYMHSLGTDLAALNDDLHDQPDVLTD